MTYDKNPKDILLRSENIDGLEFDTYGATAISAWRMITGRVAWCSRGGPHASRLVATGSITNPKERGALALKDVVNESSRRVDDRKGWRPNSNVGPPLGAAASLPPFLRPGGTAG